MVEFENEIMDQDRHLFIYGYNNEARKKLIDSIENDYPVVFDENKPIAVNVKDYGIPIMPISNKSIDYDRLRLIGREYFDFSVTDALIRRASEQYDEKTLNDRFNRIFSAINRTSYHCSSKEIRDIKELLEAIEESKDFYKGNYKEYVDTGRDYKSIETITIPFIQLDFFIKLFKESANNKSHIGVIIDRQGPVVSSSTMAANLYVGCRNNDDISMKIFTTPEGWDSYKTSNGSFIECVHDYGTIEIDDSMHKYIQKKKKEFGQ